MKRSAGITGKAGAYSREERYGRGRFASLPFHKIVGMLRLSLALVAVVAVGLLSRLRPIGWHLYDKTLGDILYAVAAYLVLAMLFYRWRPSRVALVALLLCLAIEAFQATGIPAQYAHFAAVRWLLGTTFSWHDVGCYAVGVGAVTVLDVLVLRPRCRGE